MKKFILSAICILIIGAISVQAQKKKVTQYIIDGNHVENFDGSILEGRYVNSYKIETVTQGNETVERHIILTNKSISSIKASADTTKVISFGKHPEPVYVLNDERIISKEEFNQLNINGIKSIEVIRKNDSEIAKKYSSEGRGVIIVWTKQSKSGTYEPLGDAVRVISSETQRKVKVNAKKSD
ncbi:MAG: hypothetical protein J6Y06_06795 [Bacteroidales bacterium]|nr:hypothetical protein [Bacteroidales bacterium]